MQNSIFGQSSYSERELRKIKILELEFLEWNSSSSSKKNLFSILYNSIVQKSSFKLELDF